MPGLVLLAALLIALLVAIRGLGDGGPQPPAAIAVIPLSILFVRFELVAEHPAVDPRLFTSRPFRAAVLGVLGATVILHATFLLVPLLVERLQGGTAETAGLVLLGISGLRRPRGAVRGRLSDRLGRRLPVVAGSLCTTAGSSPCGCSPSAAGRRRLRDARHRRVRDGLRRVPTAGGGDGAIPGERVGMAAGTYYTGRYLGGVLGASLAGAVLGTTVTAAGVTLGFGLLVLVGNRGHGRLIRAPGWIGPARSSG